MTPVAGEKCEVCGRPKPDPAQAEIFVEELERCPGCGRPKWRDEANS